MNEKQCFLAYHLTFAWSLRKLTSFQSFIGQTGDKGTEPRRGSKTMVAPLRCTGRLRKEREHYRG